MRHLNAGNKLGVSGPHRKALLRGLTLAILENDSIQTTRAKAKEMRWWAERAVTLAKRGDVASRRQLIQLLGSTETYRTGHNRVRLALTRLYATIAPRFRDRSGGYTQIIRLARPRAGDRADMCIMRYIPDETKKTNKSSKKTSDEKAEKKAVAEKTASKSASVDDVKSTSPAKPNKAEDKTSSFVPKKPKTSKAE